MTGYLLSVGACAARGGDDARLLPRIAAGRSSVRIRSASPAVTACSAVYHVSVRMSLRHDSTLPPAFAAIHAGDVVADAVEVVGEVAQLGGVAAGVQDRGVDRIMSSALGAMRV